MKLTRYAQSCVLIETQNKRILVDPGYIQFKDSLLGEDWANIDILLITHKHKDHCHMDAISEITKNPKTKVYTSGEVTSTYPNLNAKQVRVGDIITVDNIKIEVVKAVHGYHPQMKPKSEVSEGLGYIIDNKNKKTYLTGDTICFKNDYKSEIIFVPVSNHCVTMDPSGAAAFAKKVGSELVIPYHNESDKHPEIPKKVIEKEFKEQGLNYKFLNIGESIEV